MRPPGPPIGLRRLHVIELTADGEGVFLRLRDAAVAFDNRLRADIPDAHIAQLAEVLQRLVANVSDSRDPARKEPQS